MRRSKLPAIAIMVSWLVPCMASAQDGAETTLGGAFTGWDQIADQDYEFDPDQADLAPFAIQISGEVRFAFYQAQKAIEAGRWREAAEPLQEIINIFPNHLHKIADHPARWVGAAEYARFLLATFPSEGRNAYGEWASLRTIPRLNEALDQRDRGILTELATQWPVTAEGKRALRVLGDFALEEGDAELASRCYRRRLGFEVDGGEADVAIRAARALLLEGDLVGASRIAEPYLDRDANIGGKRVSIRDGVERLLAKSTGGASAWPMEGGNARHVRLAESTSTSFSFDRRAWSTPAFSRNASANPYENGSEPDYPFHPTASGDSLVLTDGLQVRAFSFLSPETRWRYSGPLFDPVDANSVYTFELYSRRNGYRALGSIARALPISATIAGNQVIAPMFDAHERARTISYDRTDITIPIPTRSLHSLDLRTGKLLWQQHRPERGDSFVNRVSVQNSIVVGNRVLATGFVLDGAINVYVVCFRLDDGELLWKTPIVVGQQELTMFNKAFKEFSLQAPAEANGSVFLSSNLGLIASVDTLSGEVRWATQYDTIRIDASQHYRRPRERETIWFNGPPLVGDGIVVFAPFDSAHFYGVDEATGKILWATPSDHHRALYNRLVGIQGRVLVVSGVYAIGFYDVRDGSLLAKYEYTRAQGQNYPMGRGVLGDGVVWQPMRTGLLELRWSENSLGAIQISDTLLPTSQPAGGNLLVFRDYQVLVTPSTMSVFADMDELVRKARSAVDAGEPTVEELIALGDLEAQRGAHREAVLVYERGLRHPRLQPVERDRVSDGLFRAHRELARKAEGERDFEKQREHLLAQAEYAIDDHIFLQTTEDLMRMARGVDETRYFALLDAIDRRCPDVDYPFADHQHGGRVRVPLFTLDQRAWTHLSAGRFEEAVAAWQEILARYSELPYEGGLAADHARNRIAAVIEEHGVASYARFDREASELHAAAMATKDTAALARIIETYPNATERTRYRLDLARLQLDAGEHASLFAAIAPLMNEAISVEEKAHSLYLVARGAEAAGDDGLALAVWSRLREAGGEVPILGGEGASYGKLAEREADRLRSTQSGRSGAAQLASRPPLKVRSMELDANSYSHLVPVLTGEFPAGTDRVLVYEGSGVPGAEDAALRLIDVGLMTVVWSARVDSFYNDDDPIVAYLFGDRLVVRQRRTLRAYDPADGRELYSHDLPTLPEVVVPGEGLLYLAWQQVDGRFMVAAHELATGSIFWQRELAIDLIDLQVGGGRLLVLGRDGLVVAYDALTGENLYQVPLFELSRNVEIATFPEHDLLVALGNGDAANTRYKKAMIGVSLATGARRWQIDGLFGSTRLDWLNSGDTGSATASLVLPVSGARGNAGVHALQVIDPQTGSVTDRVADVGEMRLRRFDDGPALFGRYAVLIDGERNRRRSSTPDQLAIFDMVAGDRLHHLDLQELIQDDTRYRVFAVADGSVVGVVDAWPNYPRESQTFVFLLDPRRGEVKVTSVESSGRDPSAATVTRRSLVVLKEGRLNVYGPKGVR